MEAKKEPILEAVFEKRGKRTNMWKSRYYVLTAGFLIYKSVRELTEVGRGLSILRRRYLNLKI